MQSSVFTYTLLALGVVQSAAIWRWKTWSRYTASFDSVSTSQLVPLPVLFAYRAASAAWIFYLAYLQSFVLQPAVRTLAFYTTWCWLTLGLYFTLAAVSSLRALLLRSSGTDPDRSLSWQRFAALVAALCHLNCTTSVVVVVVFWGFLVRMLLNHPDPRKAEFYRGVIFCFVSYNQHGGNVALAYVDLLLNRIRFSFRNVAVVGAFSCTFAVWGLVFHRLTGEWLYPFLNTESPAAPRIYLGLYAGHWVFYSVFAAVALARQRLTRLTPISAVKAD